MLALAFLLFFLLYFVLSAWLSWFAAKMARKRGMKGWTWGIPVFVFMAGLIFWDWMPMELLFRYKCNTGAGFTQYMTLEEWARDNPGVAETLEPFTGVRSTFKDNRERYRLNQRFAWDIIRSGHWFHIYEREERITDTQTGKVLARYVDFGTDIPPLGIGGGRLNDYKFWMQKRSCEKAGYKVNRKKFLQFEAIIESHGRNE